MLIRQGCAGARLGTLLDRPSIGVNRPTPGDTYIAMPIYAPGSPFVQTSDFDDMRSYGQHNGVDWEAPVGTPIPCAVRGVVVGRGEHANYGNMAIVKHDDPTTDHHEYTLYAHMPGTCFIPAIGTEVARGQAIGLVGNSGDSTGAHLHFELIWATANTWLSVDAPWEGGPLRRVTYGARLDPLVEANWYGMDVYQGEGTVPRPRWSCRAA